MDLKNIWVKRVVIGLGLVFLLILVLDFNSRMAELTRLSSQFESETLMIQEFLDEKEELGTKIAYANSDEAIEKWAREQGRFALPGDHPIIPLVDPDYVEIIALPELADFEEKSTWELWNQWLFGALP